MRWSGTWSSHDRMDSRRRYCLLITAHEATRRGCWALPKQNGTLQELSIWWGMTLMSWGQWSSIILLLSSMLADDLQVRAWQKGLRLVSNISALISNGGKWPLKRSIKPWCWLKAMKRWAYEVQSQKSLWGWGRPRIVKAPSPISGKIPMGLSCYPQQFWQRVKDNQWAGNHTGKHHSNP